MGQPETSERQRRARILFMGTPTFAARIVNALLEYGFNLVGVITQPDKPKGRGRLLVSSPVKKVAELKALPVYQPERLKDPGVIDTIRGLLPDVVLVAAYGKILPQEILRLPSLGCFNVHASILPAYRGAAPIPWAIINGETVTGITIFKMDSGMDTGDVLVVRSLEIQPHETAGELTERLAECAVPVVIKALEKIVLGNAALVPQDSSRATYAPLLKKADGRVDWTLHTEEIRNRIRGLDPWPGAYTFWQGSLLKLFKGHTESLDPALPPGRVVEASRRGLLIRTGSGVLRVDELQLQGSRRMNAPDFLRGHPLKEGEQLG